jgi:hypothetical protein
MSNIYIMKNDGLLSQVASQVDTNMKINKVGISSIDNFNENVCRYIKSCDEIDVPTEFIESEDIIGYIFYKIIW